MTDLRRNELVREGRAIAEAQVLDQERSIPYRPHHRGVAGSVTATILLQQINYWWTINKFQPFYKFKGPCEHTLYKRGDSWTEELGFSRREFDTALKKIGTKVKTGVSKAALLESEARECLVIYWTDSGRVTHYMLNERLYHLRIREAHEKAKGGIALYLKAESHFTYPIDDQRLPEPSTSGVPPVDDAFAYAPPAPVAVKAPRSKKQADPRTKHPAIRAVRGLVRRYPPKVLWDQVIEILGDDPSSDLLKECYAKWCGLGFNVNSWVWLLEWYKDGGAPKGNGRYRGAKAEPEEVDWFALATGGDT